MKRVNTFSIIIDRLKLFIHLILVVISYVPFEIVFDYNLELFNTTAKVNPKPFPFGVFYILLCPVVKFDTSGV